MQREVMRPDAILQEHLKLNPEQVVVMSMKNGNIRCDCAIDNPITGLFYIRILQRQVDALFSAVESVEVHKAQGSKTDA